MLSARGWGFALLLTVLLGLCWGCAKKTPEYGVFYAAGTWDIPPAFHGNPWAPGGTGHFEHFVHEPMFVYLPRSGRFIDRLGESFVESPDGTTLTVKLKKNVFWHDGAAFTSRDVESTFLVGYLKGLAIWYHLKGIELPDARTIVFRWKRPSPLNRLRALTQPINSPHHIFGPWSEKVPRLREKALRVKRGDVEALKAQASAERDVREVLFKHRPALPVGTGPFCLTRVTSSDMVLEKFHRHYEADRVKVKKIRIQRWSSNEVVWSYLVGGEVDGIAPACPYDLAGEIMKRNPGYRLITPSDLTDFGIIFNCRKPPMSHMAFRQAVAHLIDRDALRKVAYFYGDTAEGYSPGIPQSFAGRWIDSGVQDSMTRYAHDPERARKLLTGAGFVKDPDSGRWTGPDGKPISIEICAQSGLTDLILLGEAASAQLNRFGIPCQVRVVAGDLYGPMLTGGKFDMAVENGSQMSKYGQPSISLDRFFDQSGYVRMAGGLPLVMKDRAGRSVDTHAMVLALRDASTPERQKEITGELAWIANENLPYLAIYEKHSMIFIQDGPRITGWPGPDDRLWEAATGGVESVFCTMMVKGVLRPAGQ